MYRLLTALGLWLALVGAVSAQTAAYRLQPGDSIAITVLQDSKLDRTLLVGPDGSITVPLAGHIQAGGQTLQTVESLLRTRLQPSYTTMLDVSVALANSAITAKPPPTFFVTGEVNHPGSYPLVPPGANTLQAIALSGGLSPFAATRRIEILRQVNGQQIRYAFNYDDVVSGRDPGGNIDLRAGDVVVVPEKGLFGF